MKLMVAITTQVHSRRLRHTGLLCNTLGNKMVWGYSFKITHIPANSTSLLPIYHQPHLLNPSLLPKREKIISEGDFTPSIYTLKQSFISFHLKPVELYWLIEGCSRLLAADINLRVHIIHPLKVREEQAPPEPGLHDNPILLRV